MAHIKGYAFTKDWEIEAARRQARYIELGGDTARAKIITGSSTLYHRNSYTVAIPPEMDLTLLDVLILCDRGDTCFGGWVEDNGERHFTVNVNTD